MKGFEFDRARPGRLLLSFSRTDLAALDLAVWDEGKVRSLGAAALPGSAAFLPPDGRRVAWIGVAPGDAGVFVADGP